MYCKNCGYEMDPNAVVCVRCGVRKGVGTNYCPNCGRATAPNAAVCLSCGGPLVTVPAGEQKSRLTAVLLAFLLGEFGAQNFYLGYTGRAIAQLALSFCFGVGYIWSIIEGIMLLTGSIDKDANGVPLKKD